MTGVLKDATTALLPYALLLAGRFVFFILFEDLAGEYPYIIFHFLFSVLLFNLLVFLLHPVSAALSSLAVEALLLQANQVKIGIVGDAVSARDVLDIGQALALTSYAPAGFYLVAFIWALVVLLGLKYREKGWKNTLGRLPMAIPIVLVSWVFVAADSVAATHARDLMCRLNICYYSWDPVRNIKANGVLAHTIMSAEGVQVPQKAEHGFYEVQSPLAFMPGRPDVVVILCESCFTTRDKRFRTSMAWLEDEGFAAFDMLSPSYGGSTPEAELETMAGLSSGVFSGVDFQMFFDRYRDNAETLLTRYRRAGYETISLHNFRGSFWKRSTVHPKLGFQRSVFLGQMAPGFRMPRDSWPSDQILYDSAIKIYTELPENQAAFLYLITIHSHGDYLPQNNDSGEGIYHQRLDGAMEDMLIFLRNLQARAQAKHRPLAVIVFGDHKPSLSGVFYKNGVLPKTLFDGPVNSNEQPRFVFNPPYPLWKERARVPAFIRLPEPALARTLAKRLDEKPMFCLAAQLSAFVEGNDDAFWAAVHAVCEQSDKAFSTQNGNAWARFFPKGIFAERLF